MRSFYTAALCLALVHTSIARVPHSFRDLIPIAEPEPEHGVIHWISRLFKRFAQTSSTAGTCYEDVYYDFVSHLQQPSFCQQYMNIPNQTTTVDYTPTTTTTDIFSTHVETIESLTRTTPTSTLTVTTTPATTPGPALGRREMADRGLAQMQIDDAFQMFRRQNAATSSTPNDASMSQSFSSACSCLDYPGPLVTETYTDEPVTTTLSAFRQTTTTTTRTTTAAAQVATTTFIAEPTSNESSSAGSLTSSTSNESGGSSTSTSSTGEPTPTSPPFTCPDDNNTEISQMVGNERFDYLVLCDTVLMDADFYGGALSYNSFGQCASACSIADANFTEAVCQGVSYFATGSSTGNCFLKGTANMTTAANKVDSARLLRIVIGMADNSTAGTTTESAPFSGQTMTQDPQQASSMMQSILSNSSQAMPMITPPPMVVQSGMIVNVPPGQYSTQVSTGSTYSTGTHYSFSTMYSNGSWYATEYDYWSVAWSTATTVYEATATGFAVTNSTTQNQQTQTDNNGGYVETTTSDTYESLPNGQNVTEVISKDYYNSNGTLTSSTATTNYYFISTGAASGGSNGGASGASGVGGSVTSTSVFSTQSVIINSGGTAFSTGYAASGGATPTPIISATTIVNSFGTAYSTGYAASGGGSNWRGATSEAASVGPSSSTPTPISVIINSGATSGGFNSAASGGPTGAEGSSNAQASGGPTGVSGGNNTEASGGPTGTSGASSTQASGGPSSSFTDTNIPRSGPPFGSSSTVPPPGTESSIPVLPTSTGGVYVFPPSSTLSGTAPSSPSVNSTALPGTGTAPTSPSGPLPTGPSPYPSVNSTTLSGTRTAPSSTGTAPSTKFSFTNSGPPRSGPPFSSTRHPGTSPSGTSPSGTAPSGTAPSGSSSHHRPHGHTVSPVNTTVPSITRYSNTTTLSTGTGTSPPLSTLPTTLVPPSTCGNMTLGTTTIFSTTTIYGCASTCNPWGAYGSGPHHFGPPAWPTG